MPQPVSLCDLRALRARQKIRCAFWRERRAGRCKAPRRRRCGGIVEERQRRRCPPAAAPLRAAAAKTSCFTTETRVVRKNRSAGVSPASEPRQLLLGQHDLCRLEAGDTFFLTTTEFTVMRGEYLLRATWQGFLLLAAPVSRSPRTREDAKQSF